MHRFVRVGVGAAMVALAVAARGAVQAQPAPVTLPMAVTENRVPGASGQVVMTPLANNQVRVEIRITGLPPNAMRAAHIHTAAVAVCDNSSPVTYPLTNVAVNAQGVGTSATTITLRADAPVRAGGAYVNVHEGTMPVGMGVICANVTTNIVGAPTAAAPAQPAPQRPAGAPAAPAAQRAAAPAAVPAAAPRPAVAPAAQPAPAALPRTGTGLQADSASGWGMVSLALIGVLLAGTGALAVARRRID